ncbi:hypothetical protein [Burkholderia arboris]|uniref:hypothetical protein n=1 Tax=Burkholderia arboris TaxID=488730 RepID=UPI0012D8AC33|nr:hypothetical protein [Burkholderia arboris]MCA8490061.1 hypothetical protein [Burkholderia arboris]
MAQYNHKMRLPFPAAIPMQATRRAVVEMKLDGGMHSLLQRTSELRIAGKVAESVLPTTDEYGCGRKREASKRETVRQSTRPAAP